MLLKDIAATLKRIVRNEISFSVGYSEISLRESSDGCIRKDLGPMRFFLRINGMLIVSGTIKGQTHSLKERMTSEDKSDERAVAFLLDSRGSFLREKHFLPSYPRTSAGTNGGRMGDFKDLEDGPLFLGRNYLKIRRLRSRTSSEDHRRGRESSLAVRQIPHPVSHETGYAHWWLYK